MKSGIQNLLTFFLILSASTSIVAQLQLSSSSHSATIDFENTIAGVSNGLFEGSGFAPSPSAGLLDSNAWAVEGFSDGALAFGGTVTAGDLARGVTNGSGVSTGGLYALSGFPSLGGRSIAIQPGGTDFTPGTITLRIANIDTFQVINELMVSYDIYERNDGGRSSYLRFAYSTDGQTFVDLTGLDHTTTEAADQAPQFSLVGGTGPSRSVRISNLSVVPNVGEMLLRWESDDLGGSGARDEFALDNIAVSANFIAPTAAEASISGRIISSNGRPLKFVTVSILGNGLVRPIYSTSNSFGYYRFQELTVGDTYILTVLSGRYYFATPTVAVSLLKDVSDANFVGSPFSTGDVKSGDHF